MEQAQRQYRKGHGSFFQLHHVRVKRRRLRSSLAIRSLSTPIHDPPNTNIHKIQPYYHLSYTVVSLIFLSPFAGYALAAITNATIHVRLGQRGVAIIAPLCHIINYVVLCVHPPFAVVVVAGVVGGFGNGLLDSAWSAWTGGMEKANVIGGFLHSMYSIGSTLSPLIATTMVTKASMQWYEFYYFMVSYHIQFKRVC